MAAGAILSPVYSPISSYPCSETFIHPRGPKVAPSQKDISVWLAVCGVRHCVELVLDGLDQGRDVLPSELARTRRALSRVVQEHGPHTTGVRMQHLVATLGAFPGIHGLPSSSVKTWGALPGGGADPRGGIAPSTDRVTGRLEHATATTDTAWFCNHSLLSSGA